MEENSDIISLTDEEGNELLFEILDVITYEDRTYAVLLPADGEGECDEVTILRVESGETEDEEIFEGIDDPAILDAVFKEFTQRNEQEE